MSGNSTLTDNRSGSTIKRTSLVNLATSTEIRDHSASSSTTKLQVEDAENAQFLGQETEDDDILSNQDKLDETDTPINRRHQHQQGIFIQTTVQAGTALPHVDGTEQSEAVKGKPVTWLSLPRKDQLLVLTLARLSEPLTQTSLGSYLFYQLRSFDPSLPDSTISYQAGIIHAAFPGAQFLTAILWGRFADAEYGGRKRAISIGLLGAMLSVVGFGFSHNFAMAVFFRCLGGVLNGNIGVMRTMISEIIKEKKYQSRAFLLLPMTFNIGVIIGPILGKYHSNA